MCLAVPGRIVSIRDEGNLLRTALVDFNGVRRDVNLAFLPDAEVGNFVLVHVGVAISIVNPDDAARVFTYLDEIDALERGGA